jgi:hypothetical protein
MKIPSFHRKNRGLTLVEVMVIIFSLFILAVVLLPALSAPRIRRALVCMNQLKEIGMAVKISESNHAGAYPAPARASRDGLTNGAALFAEAMFQSMSNELSSPWVLACPADRGRRPASGFRTLSAKSISYFINLDALTASPQEIVAGDDNMVVRGSRVKSGLMILSNEVPLSWTADRHRLCGNVALADGSVRMLTNSNLLTAAGQAALAGKRLAVP